MILNLGQLFIKIEQLLQTCMYTTDSVLQFKKVIGGFCVFKNNIYVIVYGIFSRLNF